MNLILIDFFKKLLKSTKIMKTSISGPALLKKLKKRSY